MLDNAGRNLNAGELDAFLKEPNLARVATVTPEKLPYVIPVGFYYDGRYIYFWLRALAQSVKNIGAEPHVAITIDCNATKLNGDGRRALIQGKAELVKEDWTNLDRATMRKYFGEAALSSGNNKSRPRNCYRVKLSDSKITSWNGKGWHRRYFSKK